MKKQSHCQIHSIGATRFILIGLLAFNLIAAPPSSPTLINYSPDPTLDPSPLLVWHAVSGAAKYRIEIDTTNTFSSPYRIVDSTLAYVDTAYQTTNLLTDSIFWRVSAASTIDEWSAASVFSTFLIKEDYSTNWSYSKQIFLNTTPAGANVPGDVFNFPLLIRLNPSNFNAFPMTSPGGTDIRFAASDGTQLPYEIERWVDGAGDLDTAEIWVRTPVIYGNNSSQFIQIYYGNNAVESKSKASAVFDTTNGYIGVWHFSPLAPLKDATLYGFYGTDYGTM